MASNVISVAITSQTGGLRKGLRGAQGSLGSFDKSTRRVSLGLGTLAKGFAAFKGAQLLASSFREAGASVKLQEKLLGQTNAVIKSTGKAANVTAGDVLKLSDAIERKSLIDAEQIQNGQNVLLTFTKVRNEVGKGNDIFNQGVQAAADLSTALGTDMKGASILVGKALNDPIKGVTALTKSGVQFTEQQKAQIKALVASGDTIGAQKIILGELSTQFKGSAAAAGDTFAGKVKHLKDIWDGFLETLIKKAVPALVVIVDFMARYLPGAIAKGQAVFRGFGAVIGAVVGFVRRFGTAIKVTGAVITAVFLPAMIQATAAFVAQAARTIALNAAWLVYGITVKGISVVTKAVTAAQWLLNAAMSANPLALVIIGLVALGAALYLLWTKSDTFRAIVTGAFNKVRAAASTVVNFIKNNWKTIGVIILAVVTGPVGLAVLLIVKNFGRIKGAVSAVIGFFRDLASGIRSKISAAVGHVRDLPGKIKSALGNLGSLLLNAGKEVIQGLINGITSKVGALKDKLGSITKLIPKIKGPLSYDKVMLTPAGEAIMDGLIGGIASRESALRRQLRSVTGIISGTDASLGGSVGLAGGTGSPAIATAQGGGTTVIQVTVNAPVGSSPQEIGRAIDGYLKEYDRSRGRGR